MAQLQSSRARLRLSWKPAVLMALLLAIRIQEGDSAECYKSLTKADFPHCQLLDPRYALHWAINNDTITFGIDVDASGVWVALGLSDNGGMKGADIVRLYRNDTAPGWTLTDMHSEGFKTPIEDESQDVTLVHAPAAGNTSSVLAVFSRALVTCDPDNDIAIDVGIPQNVIFAIGGSSWNYHGPINRGTKTINFTMEGVATPPSLPADVQTVNITFDAIAVPAAETTYMCKYVQLPGDKKYHIVSYDGIAGSKYLHHLVLYRCSGAPITPPGTAVGTPWDCTDERPSCTEYYTVYAPDKLNRSTILPAEAGLPFGKGSAIWFAMEAHLNNPKLDKGMVDSSGIQFQYTSTLRANDMGVLTLGTTQLAIPAGQSNFSVPNLCPGQCTSRGFPAPVTVYATILHMHMAGSAMKTQVFRDGKELRPLATIDTYDFNFQTWHNPPAETAVLKPGDSLLTTCTYNTADRTTLTEFGLGSRDEMCYSYVFIYPRLDIIDLCTTVGSQQGRATLCAKADQLKQLNVKNQTSLLEAIAAGWIEAPAPVLGAYAPYAPTCLTPEEAQAQAAAANSSVPVNASDTAAPPPRPSAAGASRPLAWAALAAFAAALLLLL